MTSDPRLRREVNRRAYPLVTYAHTLPRWLLLVFAAAVFLAGLLTHGLVSAVLLLVVAAALLLLAFLSWPVAAPASRAARLLVIGLIAGLAVSRAVG